MKKILCFMMALVLVAVSFVSCSSEDDKKNEDKADVITSLLDLKGKSVAVQNGSTAQDILEASDVRSDISEVIGFEANTTALMDLENKTCDAVFMDKVVADYYIAKNNKKMKVLDEGLEEEIYVVGFRKNDAALRNKVQQMLCDLKKDGSLAEISKKWFGSDTTIVPESVNMDEASDDSLQKILDAGKLILGLDDSFPPMGYRDAQTNEIVGFDIDVAKAVCEKLGVELVLQPIDWNSKERELNDGNIDCIWNGMSFNDERNESMNLTEGYMNNSMVFVVNE